MDVLFVCVENLCRSPIAQAVAAGRQGQARAGTPWRFASAGVRAAWPKAPIDPRARAALERAGYEVPRHRARKVTTADFVRHHVVVALDRHSLQELRHRCPAAHAHKLRLLTDSVPGLENTDVPDPYFGPAEGFDWVVRLCEQAMPALLSTLGG